MQHTRRYLMRQKAIIKDVCMKFYDEMDASGV